MRRKVMFRGELAAVPEVLAGMRGELYAWLGEAGVPHFMAADAVLAASEAAANAVEHAYSTEDGAVIVSASIVDGELRVSVEDTGCWKPHPHEGSAGRGKGFVIMNSLMDEVAVHGSETGTYVRLSRRLERAGS